MLKILHLEDNVLDAELVEANLLMGDFAPEIQRVETREDFVAAIENGNFELIFADYNLPSFDGLSALEIAQRIQPDVPFIIISGALGEETAIETLKSGATDYILKHRLERLVPAVKRSLRESVERARASRAETALRESEERYRIVAETASDAIISVDANSTILFSNRAAEKIFGYTVEELTGQPLTMLMPIYLRPTHRAGLSRYVETGKRRLDWERVEVVGLRRDGSEFPLELSFGESNQGGQHIFIGIARDISERKQAEVERENLLVREQEARRRAEDANRLKDEFLATVSHELRTPLNAILGWATMLRGGQLDAENSQQAAEIIERNARAQVQLIEDLLDVSRIITGKLRLEIEFVDLLTILQNAIEAIRPAADAKSIEIKKEFDPNADTVCGDANRLQQIIWNLLSNAVKFTPTGGAVEIRLQKREETVEIQIEDSGEGISEDFLPFVFDRFRQADGATTRVHSGLGLGLAIVKHLVEMHGGEVRAASDGAGKGATFTVALPQQTLVSKNCLEKKQRAARNGSENGTVSQKALLEGLHVLAVDDDSDSRDMLQIILEQHGARVTTAASAAEALEKIQNGQTDVLVSDVGMPGEDGYALMEKVRALALDCCRVPSIALTGFAREEDNERALNAGFNKHVAKPVDPNTLVREIANLKKQA